MVNTVKPLDLRDAFALLNVIPDERTIRLDLVAFVYETQAAASRGFPGLRVESAALCRWGDEELVEAKWDCQIRADYPGRICVTFSKNGGAL